MTIEEHYNAIAPKLLNWLVATGSPRAEANDLVQETFLRIWRMRDALSQDPSAVSGLAFTTARNLRKNLWRDNAKLTFVDEIRDGDAGMVGPPDELPSDAEDRRAALRNRLAEAFSKLPPPLRDAYTLFQVAGLSIREISAQTGATENLVKVRIFRAKTKLREILSGMGVTIG
jgi:RNA polymerase sigma-70 factor (ECF subfamily)